MYLGHIVEIGTTDQVFAPPYHPYTEALLSAVPIADTRVEEEAHRAGGRHALGDEPAAGLPVPDPLPLEGPACPATSARPRCRRCRDLGDGHRSLCWLSDEELAQMEPVIQIAAE